MNYLPSRLARILHLATHFELQNPDLRPADCAKHIAEVDHPKETYLSNHTIAASAVQSLEDEHHFYITIEHQYREQDHWYTSARLDGELMRGTHTDATVAIGMVKISPLIIRRTVAFGLFGLGAMGLFGGIPTANILAWVFPPICFGIAGYHFWTGLVDRNSLLSAIEYLMTDAHSFSVKNKYENIEDQQIIMKRTKVSLHSVAK